MASKPGEYRSIADRPIEDSVTDLDFAILAKLPDEGSKLGHHTLATKAKEVAGQLEDTTAAQVNGRLRVLKLLGLVVDKVTYPAGDGKGWQVTPSGKDELRKYMQLNQSREEDHTAKEETWPAS
jgi:hypothetical protein